MEKQNDFLAAQLNAPDNFTLVDFYAHGLTPDNTGLKDKDYYKSIKQVQEQFSNNDGTFNDVAFDQFYDSVRRSYNDWAEGDFVESFINNIARSPENIQQMNNSNIRDTSTKLFQANDPWRHQRGFGNLYEVGKESYDIREVAQANNVRDAEGNILDWTPNDKGGLFKGIFRNPIVLATDENGQYLLDDNGNPFYRELKDGESIRNKEVLHYTDTLTKEDSWLNKFDFFDNDSLDKSVGGTITKTLVTLAPYLIPGVGQTLGTVGAVYNLAKSLPFVAKIINGAITNDNDNTEFGKTMNNWEAFFSKFDTSKSRYSMDHQWSLENVGDMVVDSAKQLFQQRTFTRIPELLKLNVSQVNPEIFGTLSIGYMALTSATDSLDIFKNAGMSDRAAAIASFAYSAALFKLMDQDYFKDWLFKNKWVNARPEITNSLKENSKAAANIMEQSIKNATANNPKLLTIGAEASKEEAQSLFKTVWTATKQAWNNKSIDPFKGIDITLPGSVNAGNVYIHHAFNEGLEETMEEGVIDAVKLTALTLESLGLNLSEDTKKNLDFGLTWNDAMQRYSTAFIGGAIGGAVFQGIDDWHSKVINRDLSNIAGRGLNGELIKNIRLYGQDAVLKELDRLHNKGVLGNKNLAMKGKWTSNPSDESKQIWTWDESGDSTNQNDFVYNVMKNRIQTLTNIMQDENLLMSDNEILKKIQSDIKSKAEAEGLSEEAYMKRHNILPFDEFAQKTGFADIILTDVGNLMIDIVQTEEAIEARKADLSMQIPDSRSSERDSVISKDAVIKQLEKQKKDYKQQLEDIENGNAASYYIRYANFASHDNLVSSLMSAEGNTTLDKDAYAYWKYRTTYTEAGEQLKSVIDKDYENYIKLKGIGALEAANSLYQHAVDLAKPLIEKQQTEYKPSRINPTVLGNYIDDSDSGNPINLLNRDGWTNMQKLIDLVQSEDVDEATLQDNVKELTSSLHLFVDDIFRSPVDANGQQYTTEKKYSDLFDMIQQFYANVNQNKELAYGIDDWVKYALKRIAQDISFRSGNIVQKIKNLKAEQKILNLSENVKNADDFNNIDYANLFTEIENPDIQALVSELITIPYNENETDENGDLTRQAQIRQDLFEYVEQEKQNFLNRNNIFRDGGSDLDRAKQLLDSAISKLDTSPEEAAEDFQKLKEFLESPTVSEDVKEDILKIFKAVENLNVADKIQKIVDIARTQAKSPVIELAKIISFDLTGEENSFLDLIESQKGVLSKKTRASEFILPQNIRRDLEVTEKVMPIVQSVLWAAANGINDEANKMLATEGKETLLPTIDNNLWYIYKQDLLFLKNQIDYMIKLTDINLNAKTREQILVRSNFYKHIVDLINSDDSNDDSVEVLKDLQIALGGFDLLEAVTRLGILSLDFEDQSKDAQIKMQIAFANLEHEIYTHVKNKKLDYNKVGRDIINVFPDSWKIKNGVLSRKFEDGLNNFDISNYFLSVVGYDSYELGRKLKTKFEGDGAFPYFGQELAIRLIAAELEHPELFNGAIDGINDTLESAKENRAINVDPNSPDLDNDIKYLEDRTKLYNTVIIDGYAGVGKSTVVFATAISFFNDVEVVGVSKIKARADALGLDSDHTFDINSLMTESLGEEYSESKFLIKNGAHSYTWKDKDKKLNLSKLFSESSKKKVLVIDECTLVKEGVWEALCTAAREQGIYIVGLGNLMQSGEITTEGTSANIDDCIGVFSTKLTISMRDSNVGKSLNNEFVGNVMNQLVAAKRDNPNFGENTIVQQNPTSPIVLKYTYDQNNKLYGDHIVTNIDDNTIDAFISSIDDNETVTIVTPDETFNALREKYKDNKNINFVSVENIQGSESDYVILNHNFDSDPKIKFTTLQSFYTLLTRAKKGTLLKSSPGLLEVLNVYDVQDPSASVDTSYDINSYVAKEYRDNRLNAINAIPENSQEESETETKLEYSETESNEIIKNDNPVNEHQLTADEVFEKIDEELDSTEEPAKITENNESGDEQLGEGLKGEKLKAYKTRKSLLEQSDSPLIDPEEYVTWLYETSDFGELSGLTDIINDNEEYIDDVRTFLHGLSSIFINHNIDDWYSIYKNRFTKIRADVINEDSDRVIQALEKSLKNKENVFFKKQFGDKMLLYYCFEGYALPISIYKPDTNESSIEGFCSINCKQLTPIIPVTSRGQSRSSISKNLPKSIQVASNGGNPITAIFTIPDDVSYDQSLFRNRMFKKGAGKAFAMLLHEFGMTDEEILNLFEPERNPEGIISYFLQNNINAYSIAGVQEDITIEDFLNVSEIINNFTYRGIGRSEKDLRNLAFVTKFFGKTEDEVRNDFQLIYELNTGANIEANAKRYGKIRKEYGLLYTREIDSLITALFAYFQDAPEYSQFTENILKHFIKISTNKTNANEIRRQGFKFSIRDSQKNEYSWYIVPTHDLQKFNVYYCGTETKGDANGTLKATFNYSDIIKSDGTFKISINNIIKQLLSEEKIANDVHAITDFNGSDDEIKSMLKNGQIRFSLATGIESDGNIEFYPPFESNVLKLIEGTNLDKNKLSEFISKSTIFKYGLYRQIKQSNRPLVENIWGRGDVDFKKLSWDIVAVLTPLFGIEETVIWEDSELREKYKALYTPIESDEIKLEINGRSITFTNGKVRCDGINDKVRTFLKNKGFTLSADQKLDSVEILSEEKIKFNFSSGGYTTPIIIEENVNVLQDLFSDYQNSNIDYSTLQNRTKVGTLTINNTNYNLVKVNNRYYVLEKDGVSFDFKVLGLSKTKDGTTCVYIESKNAFGNSIPKQIQIDSTSPLYQDTNLNFLGYLEFDLTGSKILYFIDDSNRIVRRENGKDTNWDLVDKTFDAENNLISITISDSNGQQEIISINNIVPEQQSRFTPYFGGKFKIRKHTNTWSFIGNCVAYSDFLRKISSYDQWTDGVISKINFETNKITINNKTYDLLVKKDDIIKHFSNVEEFIDFEKEFKKLLGSFEKKLVSLQDIINGLNTADDPIGIINSYLKDEIDILKSSIQVDVDDNGNFILVNNKEVEDLIINKIINSNNDLQFSKFDVFIDGNDAKISYDGNKFMVAKIKNISGDWQIELFTDDNETNFSKQDFLNRLNEIKELDPTLEDYVNVIISKTTGVKLSISQLKLNAELVTIARTVDKPTTLKEELAILNKEQPKYCRV